MRKKGALSIEFIVVLPIFMLLIWGIMQALLFINVYSATSQASEEVARSISMETRGMSGGFKEMDAVQQQRVKDTIINKIHTINEFNSFILFFEDEDGNICSPEKPSACPEVVLQEELGDSCRSALESNSSGRIVCATVIESTSGDRKHEQIVVDIRAKFKLIGNFIPGLRSLKVEGRGASQKELADRFQYYEPLCESYGGATC